MAICDLPARPRSEYARDYEPEPDIAHAGVVSARTRRIMVIASLAGAAVWALLFRLIFA